MNPEQAYKLGKEAGQKACIAWNQIADHCEADYLVFENARDAQGAEFGQCQYAWHEGYDDGWEGK